MVGRFKAWLLRHSVVIAVVGAFIFAVVVGFAAYQLSIGQIEREKIELREDQLQQRAIMNCEVQNDTRAIILMILQILAEPRAEDEPGDFEERQELLAQLTPLLDPVDCSITGDFVQQKIELEETQALIMRKWGERQEEQREELRKEREQQEQQEQFIPKPDGPVQVEQRESGESQAPGGRGVSGASNGSGDKDARTGEEQGSPREEKKEELEEQPSDDMKNDEGEEEDIDLLQALDEVAREAEEVKEVIVVKTSL